MDAILKVLSWASKLNNLKSINIINELLNNLISLETLQTVEIYF